MRLAAFEDAVYSRDAAGALYVERAFPLFMWALAAEVDALVVPGRLRPELGRAHYRVPPQGEFVALPHYASAAQPIAVGRALAGIARRLWDVFGRVDTVWVNGPGPAALVVVTLALLRRRRVVLGVRQNTREYARTRYPGRRAPQLAFALLEGIWRWLARRHPVTAVGPDIAARYAGSCAVHQYAVSFVTDADLTAPRPARAEGPVTLLSVGRLDTEKNPLLLADVMAALGDGYRLQIIGEGPMEGELRARLAELGVADRVELLGYVPLDAGLMDRYRAADAFLHVSWTEGLPQVLLEAFAARAPVVATDVGGVRATAEGAAVLIPPGDPEAAAAAVRRVSGDAGLRAELVAAGLERARAHTLQAELRRLAVFIAGDEA